MTAWLVVFVLIAGLVHLDLQAPLIGHVGSALVAVVLLYAPVVVGWRRNEDLVTYGFRLEPLGRGIGYGLGACLLIFPLFVGGYVLFYQVVCGSGSLEALAPPGMCGRWHGWDQLAGPALDWGLAEFALVQAVVVALPEELFFRGCLLYLLERALPPRHRLWGGGIGWALVLTSVLFALIHLPKDGDARALATFFPALLFGWMRSATGSILAPTIAHAGANILVHVLDRMVVGGTAG